jgi:hypothetical protein
MPIERDDDIVKLATAPNPAQAHIWQQALENEGIVCHTVGDYLDASFGDIPGVSAEIWVHRNDVARAEQILQRARQQAAADLPPDDEE